MTSHIPSDKSGFFLWPSESGPSPAYISLASPWTTPSLDHSFTPQFSFSLSALKLFHGKGLCAVSSAWATFYLHPLTCLIPSGFSLKFPSLRDAVPNSRTVPSILHPHWTPPFSLLSSTFHSCNQITIWAMFNVSSSCFLRAGTIHLAYSSMYSQYLPWRRCSINSHLLLYRWKKGSSVGLMTCPKSPNLTVVVKI